ncbi:trypsin Inhibitor like cysteine rich domain protein [Oesophagostomum dentatum]|uniref:Trypsin Inhibitor like cysteine rich domain protein n=1 Tax=Oesophagostomum dentatum TaxID=61180 RepID=A0A0B1S7Q6_OESDE|nr:trypsin Inhibitor like cysteine rich domain protein [Oesophagostomum dentatum]
MNTRSAHMKRAESHPLNGSAEQISVTFVRTVELAVEQYHSEEETCPLNEEYRTCGTACEPTCENPNPRICTKQCVRGCQCKSGFYRNANNVCVSDCDKTDDDSRYKTCPPNEEFRECGTACEPTCRNPNPKICTLQCILDVCQCKSGFYRNDNGDCVSECSKEGK